MGSRTVRTSAIQRLSGPSTGHYENNFISIDTEIKSPFSAILILIGIFCLAAFVGILVFEILT